MRAKLKIDTQTNSYSNPLGDELIEGDYLKRVEEDILQPMPDELEMVDYLDLDMPAVDISLSEATNPIDMVNAEDERTELFDIIAEQENEQDSGQFFEQPKRATEQEGEPTNSTIFSNKKLLLVLGGLTLIVLLAISYIITHVDDNNIIDVQEKSGSVSRGYETDGQ